MTNEMSGTSLDGDSICI